MIGQYFYNQSTRNVVVAFGTLFNQIQLSKKDASGNVIQSMKVPLAYGPKQKWLSRLTEDPNLSKKVAVTLPRIGFEISGLTYDSTRKLNKIMKVKKVADGTDSEQVKSGFMPVPYNINFELYVLSKNSDDALQIVEQILPYFAPQYTVTVKPFADIPTLLEDVPINLRQVTMSDTQQDALGSRRTIIYTLSFEMKISLHGPLSDGGQKIIRDVRTNYFLQGADSDEYIHTTKLVPTPTGVSADSDYGFALTYMDSDGL